MNNVFAIVYARQGGPEMRDLIELRSTAALPIAGRYRVIDVVLSNITDSGVRSVGVITQRNYNSLMDHLGSGKEWDLSKKVGGLTLLPPYDLSTGNERDRGLIDSLLNKRDFIEHQRWPYCLLMGADYVYRQDFNAMMDLHMNAEADITVLCSQHENLMKNDANTAKSFFTLEGDRVVDLTLEPTGSDECYANMRACLMDKDLLKRLVEDSGAEGGYEFDMDLLKPAVRDLKVVAYKHEGYVKHVSTVKSYFELNQDMLDKNLRSEFFNPDFPVYTKTMDAPPTKFNRGCDVEHSLFGNGCDIKGHVKNSIVFRGVHIAETADVENCIIMQHARIGSGAKLRNMIIDKEAVIKEGVRCIAAPYDPMIIRKREIVDKDL